MSEDSATQQGVEGQGSPQVADEITRLAEIVAAQEAGNEANPTAVSEDAQGHPEDAKQNDKPTPEPPRTVKVKVDGEEREVPLDDVLTRYQKAEAADKRLQEASLKLRDAESRASSVSTERQQLAQALDHFVRQAQAFMPQPPDASLAQSDPASYVQQKALYESSLARLQQAQAAQAHLATRQRADEEVALRNAVPEWADDEKYEYGKAQLRSALKSLGFTDAVIGSMGNHKDVLAARQLVELKKQADAYQQILSKAKELPKQVVKTAPKNVEKPGVAGSAIDGRTQAMQRLSRSGRVEDAAAVFRGLL